MDPRQLRAFGLLAGALLALGGFLALAPKADVEEGTAVHAGLDLADARSILIERHREDRAERVRLEKRDGVWWVAEPFEAAADADVVFGVLDAVQSARRGVPVAGDPADFGLAPPEVTVDVGTSGEPVHLEVGVTAPIGLQTYVAGPGGPVVVQGHPADLFTKRAQEYRDHKVFTYRPGDVTRVSVESALGRLEATKSAQGWYLTGFSRADLNALDDWIVDLLRLRVDLFLDLDHTTIEDARFTVEVETPAGTQRMQVGRDTPYGPLVLFGDGLDGVIEPGLLAMLERGPTDVGETTAFPWDPDAVVRVRISGAREAVLEPPWSPSPAITALSSAQLVYRREPPVWTGPELTVVLETAGAEHPMEVGPVDAEGFRAVRDVLGGEPMRVPAEELEPLFR